MTLGFDLLMRVYYNVIDPIFVRLRKQERLNDWASDGHPQTLDLNLSENLAKGAGAAMALQRFRRVALRYDMRFGAENAQRAKRRATPMMLDLSTCIDNEAFERILRRHSNRTLPKIRKALRLNYSVRQFALPMHVYDLHEVKISMPIRSGGPVAARWLLKPDDLATPAQTSVAADVPECPTHWTVWWGVFLPEPGHMNGALQTNERLVAYIKLTRCGDVVHYLDIMGHKDHLENGVMMLVHAHIVAWLQQAAEPSAVGVKAIWYGALEHGVPGLITWKKRAGFVPVRVRLHLSADAGISEQKRLVEEVLETT
ncbi:hypothetical protein [Glaciimonas soli]|uniref:Acetyltransferase (GNAT) family protein n=1 Tax=Glaciimonas soli TaxID=2590999 RepID=A0A843YTE8_9BURK|nr:hypothetical protein [Glaciimonas soli]MQR01277.1 hypothetical protein [Glaciimonas soli]